METGVLDTTLLQGYGWYGFGRVVEVAVLAM
jgi:hypothetical protein